MEISVKTITDMAFSYENGMDLRKEISKALAKGEKVILNFDGITVFTTMFFNACSGHYVLSKSLEWYNENINCINLNELGKQTHKHSVENAVKKRDAQLSEKEAKLTQITSETISEHS